MQAISREIWHSTILEIGLVKKGTLLDSFLKMDPHEDLSETRSLEEIRCLLRSVADESFCTVQVARAVGENSELVTRKGRVAMSHYAHRAPHGLDETNDKHPPFSVRKFDSSFNPSQIFVPTQKDPSNQLSAVDGCPAFLIAVFIPYRCPLKARCDNHTMAKTSESYAVVRANSLCRSPFISVGPSAIVSSKSC
jgi:hypothetical protein